MNKYKDGFFLLITALVFSGLAWLFWHYAGENAFSIMITLVIVVLFYDNYRLRKKK